MNRRMMMQIRNNVAKEKTFTINCVFTNPNTYFGYYFPWSEIQDFLGKTVIVNIDLTCKIVDKNGTKPSTANFMPCGYRPNWSTIAINGLSDNPDSDGYYTQDVSVETHLDFPAEAVGTGPFTYRTNYSNGNIKGTIKITEV